MLFRSEGEAGGSGALSCAYALLDPAASTVGESAGEHLGGTAHSRSQDGWLFFGE